MVHPIAALYVVVIVASVAADSALVGEDSSGNLVLDKRPGRARPRPLLSSRSRSPLRHLIIKV